MTFGNTTAKVDLIVTKTHNSVLRRKITKKTVKKCFISAQVSPLQVSAFLSPWLQTEEAKNKYGAFFSFLPPLQKKGPKS